MQSRGSPDQFRYIFEFIVIFQYMMQHAHRLQLWRSLFIKYIFKVSGHNVCLGEIMDVFRACNIWTICLEALIHLSFHCAVLKLCQKKTYRKVITETPQYNYVLKASFERYLKPGLTFYWKSLVFIFFCTTSRLVIQVQTVPKFAWIN